MRPPVRFMVFAPAVRAVLTPHSGSSTKQSIFLEVPPPSLDDRERCCVGKPQLPCPQAEWGHAHLQGRTMIESEHFGLDTRVPEHRELDCVAAALALHKLTNWSLYCLIAYEVDFGAKVLASHMVVESPCGFFDLAGPEAAERWWENLGRQNWQSDLSLVDVAVRATTAEFLRECFREKGDVASNHELDAAVWRAVPLARAALQRYGYAPLAEIAASAS